MDQKITNIEIKQKNRTSIFSLFRSGAQLSYIIADKRVEVLADRTLMGHENYPMVLAKGKTV